MLGERDESRTCVGAVSVESLEDSETLEEKEMMSSASTSSRGMRSIWRPTRLGM